jgi:hypothetical protein
MTLVISELRAIAGIEGLIIDGELDNLQDSGKCNIAKLNFYLDNLKIGGKMKSYEFYVGIFNDLMPQISVY